MKNPMAKVKWIVKNQATKFKKQKAEKNRNKNLGENLKLLLFASYKYGT